jgi:hypothetical protein
MFVGARGDSCECRRCTSKTRRRMERCDLASHESQQPSPNEADPLGPRRGPRVVCGSTSEDAGWSRHHSYAAEARDVSRETSRIPPCQPLSALEHFPNLTSGVAQRSVLPSPKPRGRSRWILKSVPRIHKPCETGIDCKDPYRAAQHAASAFGLHDPAAWWSPKEPKPASPLRVPVQTQVATTPLE